MLSAAMFLLMLQKPNCNKEIRGEMWPMVANGNQAALMLLARAGTLEMCTSIHHRYRWERLSLRADKP
jgi:hypothetical protein